MRNVEKDTILKFRSSTNNKVTDDLLDDDLIQSISIIYNNLEEQDSCRFDTTFFYIEYKYYYKKKTLSLTNVFKDNINNRLEYILSGIEDKKYQNTKDIVRNIITLNEMNRNELSTESHIYLKDKSLNEVLEIIQNSLNTSNESYLEKLKTIYKNHCDSKIDLEINNLRSKIEDRKIIREDNNFTIYNTEKLNELIEFKDYLNNKFLHLSLKDFILI